MASSKKDILFDLFVVVGGLEGFASACKIEYQKYAPVTAVREMADIHFKLGA